MSSLITCRKQEIDGIDLPSIYCAREKNSIKLKCDSNWIIPMKSEFFFDEALTAGTLIKIISLTDGIDINIWNGTKFIRNSMNLNQSVTVDARATFWVNNATSSNILIELKIENEEC